MADRVLEDVDQWITQHTHIQFAPPVQGGWERWAQVDFSLYLNALVPPEFAILEDACYASGQRDDLTVAPQAGGVPGAIMELKVLNASESLAHYRTKLTSDQHKLTQPMVPARHHYRKCSFGIAPASRLIPLLRAVYPGPVTLANFEGYLQRYVPSHHIERATSISGDVWAIQFVYVD